MNWLLQIHATHAVAHAIGVLALVCLAGMALGSVKVRGIGLGTAGVLFAGILASVCNLGPVSWTPYASRALRSTRSPRRWSRSEH